ncbi:8-amino-7-oxononanoate synthase [Methylovirgula ligni]|uniref:8-amino-7-oxononanoate synthase n=1 Tax=Methylovirgula ligni TaxID=569860 RepID=A0A3D9Z1Z0_9HYPH|nr:aminotransferase class I/II-fold pyridoxal phosphate-dependent enzyme [Methylovirgula ligni]REF88010.1 8-amino-7-oxononanoate synthase [Methylovirgula ligni]
MTSLDAFAESKLAQLEQHALRRALTVTTRTDGAMVYRGGRQFVSFSCNDYLGLSQHPHVKAAALAAIETYGTGAGASRLVTGNHPLLVELEARLAKLKQAPAARVFGSGYLTNLGVIPALAGEGDLILADELSHACIFAGSQLSAATLLTFRHNDAEHAEDILKAERGKYRNVLLITETVFSMDGDRAPLAALAGICAAHDVWLMSDDAHGLGVLAPGDVRAPLQMGTLSKVLGSYGGYLCASLPVVDLMTSRARTVVYSTGLPPAAAAAAIAALDIIAADPALTARPLTKARAFTQRLGLPDAQSPIVPLVLGSAEAALEASRLLQDEGFLVVAIRPPTVAEGSARLRFAFSAAHSDADVARLADVVTTRLDMRVQA